MRVLQLIDSLDPGGAERIAVTLANALSQRVEFSALCATRKEGSLKGSLDPGVDYLFLRKKHTLDIFSLIRLCRYVRKKQVSVLHAHSSSFFFATLIKVFRPKMLLVWHDHYGKSEALHDRRTGLLRFSSRYFDRILSVNVLLRDWALENLICREVHFLRNFVPLGNLSRPSERISGDRDLNLVCLANFRPQKNHFNLVQAYAALRESHHDITLHLIGKVVDRAYYDRLSDYIADQKLDQIIMHGEQQEVLGFLERCSIGILSSDSEGLPVALLEYGIAGLAVVTTDVGECAGVVNGFGRIVAPGDSQALWEGIRTYLEDPQLKSRDAASFQKHVVENYSAQSVLPKLMNLYKI